MANIIESTNDQDIARLCRGSQDFFRQKIENTISAALHFDRSAFKNGYTISMGTIKAMRAFPKIHSEFDKYYCLGQVKLQEMENPEKQNSPRQLRKQLMSYFEYMQNKCLEFQWERIECDFIDFSIIFRYFTFEFHLYFSRQGVLRHLFRELILDLDRNIPNNNIELQNMLKDYTNC